MIDNVVDRVLARSRRAPVLRRARSPADRTAGRPRRGDVRLAIDPALEPVRHWASTNARRVWVLWLLSKPWQRIADQWQHGWQLLGVANDEHHTYKPKYWARARACSRSASCPRPRRRRLAADPAARPLVRRPPASIDAPGPGDARRRLVREPGGDVRRLGRDRAPLLRLWTARRPRPRDGARLVRGRDQRSPITWICDLLSGSPWTVIACEAMRAVQVDVGGLAAADAPLHVDVLLLAVRVADLDEVDVGRAADRLRRAGGGTGRATGRCRRSCLRWMSIAVRVTQLRVRASRSPARSWRASSRSSACASGAASGTAPSSAASKAIFFMTNLPAGRDCIGRASTLGRSRTACDGADTRVTARRMQPAWNRLLRALFAVYAGLTARAHRLGDGTTSRSRSTRGTSRSDTGAKPFSLSPVRPLLGLRVHALEPARRAGVHVPRVQARRGSRSIATPVAFVALTLAVFVLGTGRWPRRGRDLALWAIAIGSCWFALPQLGKTMFCRAYGANYVYGAAIQLWFLVPLRLARACDAAADRADAVARRRRRAVQRAHRAGAVPACSATRVARGGRASGSRWPARSGAIVGFAAIFFAPGQGQRYEGLAQQTSLVGRLLQRGVIRQPRDPARRAARRRAAARGDRDRDDRRARAAEAARLAAFVGGARRRRRRW